MTDNDTSLIEAVARKAGWIQDEKNLCWYVDAMDSNGTHVADPWRMEARGIVFLLEALLREGWAVYAENEPFVAYLRNTITFVAADTLWRALALAYVA